MPQFYVQEEITYLVEGNDPDHAYEVLANMSYTERLLAEQLVETADIWEKSNGS